MNINEFQIYAQGDDIARLVRYNLNRELDYADIETFPMVAVAMATGSKGCAFRFHYDVEDGDGTLEYCQSFSAEDRARLQRISDEGKLDVRFKLKGIENSPEFVYRARINKIGTRDIRVGWEPVGLAVVVPYD